MRQLVRSEALPKDVGGKVDLGSRGESGLEGAGLEGAGLDRGQVLTGGAGFDLSSAGTAFRLDCDA